MIISTQDKVHHVLTLFTERYVSQKKNYNCPTCIQLGPWAHEIVWSYELKLPFDLVFQFSGCSKFLSDDDVNKSLWCRHVPEMSIPTLHPVADLRIWDQIYIWWVDSPVAWLSQWVGLFSIACSSRRNLCQQPQLGPRPNLWWSISQTIEFFDLKELPWFPGFISSAVMISLKSFLSSSFPIHFLADSAVTFLSWPLDVWSAEGIWPPHSILCLEGSSDSFWDKKLTSLGSRQGSPECVQEQL